MGLRSFATVHRDTDRNQKNTALSSTKVHMTHDVDMTAAPAQGACGLSQGAWLDRLSEIGRSHGFFERLGRDHLTLFVQEGDTLLVTFDSAARVHAEEADGLPLGFEAVPRREWSLLSIQSLADDWFRSGDLMAFFDHLSDAGFFDSFQRVIFLGFGPACGHAACAYSSAAPGALVLAAAPAATLDPELAGFDPRFRDQRKRDFSRYGDAPGLVSAAALAVILYDPAHPASAAHAAQFRADCVTLAPLRFTGAAPHRLIRSGGRLMAFLRALVNQRLGREKVATLIRPVSRVDGDYLWGLARIAQQHGQFDRARRIADYAADVTGEDRFADLARQLGPPAAS